MVQSDLGFDIIIGLSPLTDVGGGGPAIVSKSPKFSSLHVKERTIQDCDPEDTTAIKESYPA